MPAASGSQPPSNAAAASFALLPPSGLLPSSPVVATGSGDSNGSNATTTTTTTTASTTTTTPAPARFSSEGERGLPPSLRGLQLGAPLASGSHGRVFRGRFPLPTTTGQGDATVMTRVAVKVLDAADVHRLDPSTGGPLEGALGEGLRHPFVVRTLAWGVVGDPDTALPARPRAWTRVPAGAAGAGAAANGSGIGGGSGGAARPAVVYGEPLFSEDEEEEEEQEGEDAGPAAAAGPLSSAAAAQASTSTSSSSAADRKPRRRRRNNTTKQAWLVLEHCDQGCLQDAIDSGWLRTSRDPRIGTTHLPALLATAREIAGGMAYLHAQGIVHGDLSAWNVLLSSGAPTAGLAQRSWAAQVADFGLARPVAGWWKQGGEDSGGKTTAAAAERQSVFLTGTHGTVAYCAPEVLSRGELSPAADVYGFGAILWQMYTGLRPWRGLSHAQVVEAVGREGKVLLWPDEAPDGLAALGEACCSPEPRDRPTFADVLEVLQPLVALIERAEEQQEEGG